MEQGEVRSLPSGKAETNPYLLGETDPAPPGSGEAESIPQPSGETKPALKASGETETSPVPSGEAEPHQRHQASRVYPSAFGRDRAHPKGVGRDGD